MQVEFNAAEVQRLLETWKKNADLQSPMSDDLKITFMSMRRKLLDSYVDVGTVILQIMEQMTPLEDLENFEKAKASAKAFRTWAQNGLIEIEKLNQ